MTLIAIGSLLAAAISSALAGYTWSRRATRGATCFTGLVVCIAGWCLASAGASVSPSLEAKLLWSQIACSSVAVGSLIWLFFALEHAAAPTIAERKSLLLLFLVPSATVALVWTNSMHGLIWGGASMSSPDQLLATPGPWFVWAHIPYSVALIVAGQGVLIAHGLRYSAVYRLRSAILTVAAAVPLVVGAAFFGSAAASGADPTPLAFSIATLIMAWALFSRRFAGLGPLAYEAVFRSMGDALFLVDESDRVVMMNPEASARSGKTLEEVTGKPVSEVIKPWSEALDHLAESTRGRVAAVLDEEGETRQLEVRVFPLNDWKGGFRGRVFVSQDVTEQSAFSKLEEMAYRDFLTGLLNRRAFYEEAEKALVVARRRSDKFAMVLLDLDGFKDVNDSHGHAAGDLLLQRVATRLHDELRREDTVGRLGGDEFGVILQDCTTERAANTVHRLVLAIKSRPFEIKETMVDLDVSAGVALFPEAGDQVEDLVSRADAAMYQAKQGIGGICFFDPEGDELSEELLQLESEMRGALTNEEMEFRYQPICNTATGEAVGVEALVRWRHPVNGITLPDAFLSKFKQRGLAVDLDSHVLRRVLEQVAESSLSVAVNLSSQTAVDVDLPIRVKNLLRATGVEPRRLILEISEQDLAPPEAATPILVAVHDLGVRIAADDFGTGYSSLAYLRHFPLDILKLDRLLVAGIGQRVEDEAIARAVIMMANSIGLDVVAEGVETEEQLEWLKAAGCGLAQGFYLARPTPWLNLAPELREGANLNS